MISEDGELHVLLFALNSERIVKRAKAVFEVNVHIWKDDIFTYDVKYAIEINIQLVMIWH